MGGEMKITIKGECKMEYRWEVESEVEIFTSRKVKRYLITPMGGYFPVLLKIQNGDLLAVVRGGDYHVGERGCLDAVRSKDGGKSWFRATPIVNEGPDDRNPAVAQLRDGTILVAFFKVNGFTNGKIDNKKIKEGRGRCHLFITRSFDNGQTWEKAKPMAGIPPEMCSPFGKMIELPDKTILAAIYGLDSSGQRDDHSWLFRSRDGGQTWGDESLIGEGFNETALLQLPSGKILAALRGYEVDAMWVNESLDNGYTWSKPRQVTQASEHPGDLLLLPSGKVLLVYGRRLRPYGVRALVSYDEAHTWDYDHKITLVADADTPDCGYPSSALLEDGTIGTAYYSVDNETPFVYTKEHCWGIHCGLVRYREEDIS